MIRIVSRTDGFRRCGIAHSVNPVDWPDDRFSDEELARLQAEPMLMVEVLADPVVVVAVGADLSAQASEEAATVVVLDNADAQSAVIDATIKPSKKQG